MTLDGLHRRVNEVLLAALLRERGSPEERAVTELALLDLAERVACELEADGAAEWAMPPGRVGEAYARMAEEGLDRCPAFSACVRAFRRIERRRRQDASAAAGQRERVLAAMT